MEGPWSWKVGLVLTVIYWSTMAPVAQAPVGDGEVVAMGFGFSCSFCSASAVKSVASSVVNTVSNAASSVVNTVSNAVKSATSQSIGTAVSAVLGLGSAAVDVVKQAASNTANYVTNVVANGPLVPVATYFSNLVDTGCCFLPSPAPAPTPAPDDHYRKVTPESVPGYTCVTNAQGQASGKVWKNGVCYNPSEMTVQAVCTALRDLLWIDGGCYANQHEADVANCGASSKVWVSDAVGCKTPAEACTIRAKETGAEGYYVSEPPSSLPGGSHCFASKADYDQMVCTSTVPGNTWLSASDVELHLPAGCYTFDDLVKAACLAKDPFNVYLPAAASFSGKPTCLGAVQIAQMCESNGWTWAAGRCQVYSAAQVPRGIESFFLVLQQGQEQAASGDDAFNAPAGVEGSSAVEEANAAVASFYQKQVADAQVKLEAAIARGDTTSAEAYRGTIASYQSALKAQQDAQGAANAALSFLKEQASQSSYPESQNPSTSLGALQSLVGAGNAYVQITFPNGFPTPTRGSDNASWIAAVPVNIVFPSATFSLATVQYQGRTLAYKFSGDGGKTFSPHNITFDFDGGSGARTAGIVLKSAFADTGTNYHLVVSVGVTVDETFTFKNGQVVKMPAFRQASIDRSFYTTANILSTGSATESAWDARGQGVSEGEGSTDSTGNTPSGQEQLANWLAYSKSNAMAAAVKVDQKTGLGLKWVVKYWWTIPVILAGLIVGWRIYRSHHPKEEPLSKLPDDLPWWRRLFNREPKAPIAPLSPRLEADLKRLRELQDLEGK